jgi:hypothetical protein
LQYKFVNITNGIYIVSSKDDNSDVFSEREPVIETSPPKWGRIKITKQAGSAKPTS